MALELKQLEDDFFFATWDGIVSGVDLSDEPSRIDPEYAALIRNLVYFKDLLRPDTGHTLIGATLASTPRRTIKWERNNGSIEYITICNSHVYRWNDTLLKWLKLPSSTRTTASLGEAAGSTALDVASGVGFANGNTIEITLDNGDLHETTISAGGGTSTLTIAAGIPGGRTVPIGAAVYKPISLSGSSSEEVDFCIFTAVEWLVFCNGIDKPQYYDGTSVQVVPNLPSGGNFVARTCEVFNETLFFGDVVEGGTYMPYRIRRSNVGDPTDWSTGTAGFNDLLDKPDGIQKLKQLGPYLIVYRENAISRGTWVGSEDLTISFELALGQTGIVGVRAVAEVEGMHIILANDGVHRYQGGFDVQHIDDKVNDFIYGYDGQLNAANAFHSHIEYIEELTEVWVAIPTASNAYLDTILRWRLHDDKWFFRSFSQQIVGFGEFAITSLTQWNELVGTWLAQGGSWVSRTFVVGSPSTVLCCQSPDRVFEYDYGSGTDNGTAIDWRVETKDFTARDKILRIDRIDALVKGTAILVQYSLDGGANWSTYGTFADSAVIGKQRLFKQVSGERIRFSFSGSGQGFALGWLGFKYREESEW